MRSKINFEILKELQRDFKHRSITTPELVAYFNLNAKRNLQYLFDQFLCNVEVPKLELRVKQRKDDFKVEYRWNNVQKDFAMPFG